MNKKVKKKRTKKNKSVMKVKLIIKMDNKKKITSKMRIVQKKKKIKKMENKMID
jgi:hypothetical protein